MRETVLDLGSTSFFALLATHIPCRYVSLITYYGVYSSSHRGPFCGFSEPSKAMEIPSSKELHRKPNQKTKHRKIKSVNPPPSADEKVKLFP